MKKFFVLLLVAMLVLTGCQKPKEPEKELPQDFSRDFIIADNKQILTKVPEDKQILDWYSDPSCASCIDLVGIADEFLGDVLQKNNAVVRYHFLNFLDRGDKNGHSTTVAAYLYQIAEKHPEMFFDFYKKVMNFEWLGTISEKEPTESFIERTILDIEGTQAQYNELKENIDKYKERVVQVTANVIDDKDLASKSPAESLFTPFLVGSKSDKAIDFSKVENVKSAIEEQLKN